MNCNSFVDLKVKKLLDMIYAPMYTKTLFAAIELNIFSELKESKLYTEVAENLKLNRDNTKWLLNALAGMELLHKEKGFYRNSSLSNRYLVKDSDWFIGDHLRIYNSSSGYDGLDIVKLIKEGPKNEESDKEGLEAYAVFGDWTEILKTGQKGGRAKEIAEMVSDLPEFLHFKKMLDLGGGPGLIGIEIIKKNPKLKGVIFDAADVGKVADESIKENKLENRVEVLTGDYLKDYIGKDYDFILAIATLNFAKHNMDFIMKKIYDALNPGGVFMCISEGLTCEDTKPKEIVVSWLPSFLKGFDFSLRQGEVSDSALRCGFKTVYKQTVSMFSGDMDVDIARK
ncbi:class I SAM-dependent methyltransferase [Anaerovorax odorimutans]|uniref:class I SAM-dependent methyltransferase n=1 Tax=Anaerovorax odorimutans TaxID=109327 RepID=UPI0003F8D023|nr:class I SAM-dependent methyltransferase [Anaerovorax odorimutans]